MAWKWIAGKAWQVVRSREWLYSAQYETAVWLNLRHSYMKSPRFWYCTANASFSLNLHNCIPQQNSTTLLWLHSKEKVWGWVHSHKFYSFFHSVCRLAVVIEATGGETTDPLSSFISLNSTFKNTLLYLCFDKYYSMSVTIIINIFQFL
jgi:hypothetical protein